jgi:nitrogenase molybdenum-iron protein beta chain
LNIVVSPVNGVDAAQVFKEIHGVDHFITDLPIGAKATSTFLYDVAKRVKITKKVVDSFVETEQKNYYHFYGRISDSYADLDLQRYTVVVADTTYAVSLARFAAQELGWLPTLVAITDPTDDDKKSALQQRFKGFLANPETAVVFESDASQVAKHHYQIWPKSDGSKYYRPFGPAVVIGSRLDRDFADEIKAGHLSVTYPISNRFVLNRGYAGFTGALNLTEDLLSVVVANR